MALRSPRTARVWHLCLLAGLALSATGGIGIEQLRPQLQGPICDNLGRLRLDGCLLTFEYEEALEFAGMWLVLLSMLGHFSDSASGRRFTRASPLVRHASIVDSLARQRPLHPSAIPGPAGFNPIESDVELLEFRVDKGDRAVIVELDASARRGGHAALGYSVHLVDQVRGGSVAGRDARWCCQQDSIGDFCFSCGSISHLKRLHRALWIGSGGEQADEFEGLHVLAGDLQA